MVTKFNSPTQNERLGQRIFQGMLHCENIMYSREYLVGNLSTLKRY